MLSMYINPAFNRMLKPVLKEAFCCSRFANLPKNTSVIDQQVRKIFLIARDSAPVYSLSSLCRRSNQTWSGSLMAKAIKEGNIEEVQRLVISGWNIREEKLIIYFGEKRARHNIFGFTEALFQAKDRNFVLQVLDLFSSAPSACFKLEDVLYQSVEERNFEFALFLLKEIPDFPLSKKEGEAIIDILFSDSEYSEYCSMMIGEGGVDFFIGIVEILSKKYPNNVYLERSLGNAKRYIIDAELTTWLFTNATDFQNAKDLAEEISSLSIRIDVAAGPEGILDRPLTKSDVAAILKKEGFKFNEKNILLSQPIKEVGNHEIKLKLTEDFIDNITASFVLTIGGECRF